MEYKQHKYFDHTLNKSPSKATYTFSKAERFKNDSPPKKYNLQQEIYLKPHVNPLKTNYEIKDRKGIPNNQPQKNFSRSMSQNKSLSRNKNQNKPLRVNMEKSKSSGKGSVGKYQQYKNKQKTTAYDTIKNKNKRYKNHDNTSPMHTDLGGWPNSKQWFHSTNNKFLSPESKNKKIFSPQNSSRNQKQRHSPYKKTAVGNIEGSRGNIEGFRQSDYKTRVGPGYYDVSQRKIGQYPDSRYKNNLAGSFSKSPRNKQNSSSSLDIILKQYTPFSEFGTPS